MKYGHRQTLDPHQVKSSTGLNKDAWPLRVNDRRECRCIIDDRKRMRAEQEARGHGA